MTNWPRGNRPADLNAFYGDPDRNDDMSPDASWEAANIVRIATPYPLFYEEKRVSGIRVHRKCADSLTRILTRISKEMTPEEIKRYRLDEYGGCYNFRMMRAANRLSMHSWGCAIDLSPTYNYFQRRYRPDVKNNPMMPRKVIQIFADEGWRSGAMMWSKDAMHFEATS